MTEIELTDADWARVYALFHAYRRQVAPAEPVRSAEDYRGLITHLPASTRPGVWARRDAAGEIVAFAWAVVHSASTVWIGDLVVSPEHRRQGHGRALLSTIIEYAGQCGCPSVGGSVAGGPGVPFAEAAGARASNRVRRSVWTPPLDPARRPELPAGYSLRSWSGAGPEDIYESYVVARSAIEDAPSDDSFEADPWTPQRVREMEEAVAARGSEMRVSAAIAPDGTVAGFTDLRVTGDLATIDDTAVVAGHRGQGVAQAVKYESLRLLVAERPAVRQVTTSNDVSNAAMLAVNTKLGFTEVAHWTHYFVSVPPVRVPSLSLSQP